MDLEMALYEEAVEAIEKEAVEANITGECVEQQRVTMPDLSFLAASTGEGSIESYIEHPLNFDKTASTARILRGFTGLCGQLDYALIDILLGIVDKLRGDGHVANNAG